MIQQGVFDVGEKRGADEGKVVDDRADNGSFGEGEALLVQLKKLEQQEGRQRMINREIQMLQLQSQQAYECLRQLTLEFNDKIGLYNSKIENRSQDIYDERDKIQSNLYYIHQQNQFYDQQCRNKLQERQKLQQQTQLYHSKRQHFTALLANQKMEFQRIIKNNQEIKDKIQNTRRQLQKCQQELYQLDLRVENCKKYGYQVIPKRMMQLIDTKQAIQREKDELKQQKDMQYRMMGKMVKLELSERVKADLQLQTQKRNESIRLHQSNNALLQENERLNQIKYEYQWNPNLQIKQLQVNLQEEEKRIVAIEKDIHSIKKKSTEIGQKIKQYNDHYENTEQSEITATTSELQSPRKQKQKRQRREKTKKSRHHLYEQIEKDLLNTRISNKYNWRDWFKMGSQAQIIIDELTYKVKKSSQKLSILLMTFFLLGCVVMCHLNFRK